MRFDIVSDCDTGSCHDQCCAESFAAIMRVLKEDKVCKLIIRVLKGDMGLQTYHSDIVVWQTMRVLFCNMSLQTYHESYTGGYGSQAYHDCYAGVYGYSDLS